MKTENLMKACDTCDLFVKELRASHKDAVESDNQFAEILLLSLIEEAATLQTKMNRIKDAARSSK